MNILELFPISMATIVCISLMLYYIHLTIAERKRTKSLIVQPRKIRSVIVKEDGTIIIRGRLRKKILKQISKEYI